MLQDPRCLLDGYDADAEIPCQFAQSPDLRPCWRCENALTQRFSCLLNQWGAGLRHGRIIATFRNDRNGVIGI